jgi:hypothetical protein
MSTFSRDENKGLLSVKRPCFHGFVQATLNVGEITVQQQKA